MTSPETRPDGIVVSDIFVGVWRYRAAIAAATVTAAGIAILLTLRTPRLYESTATLVVNPPKLSDPVPLMVDGAKLVEFSSPSVTNLSTASVEPMLQSRSIAATVIRELSLDRDPFKVTPSAFLEDIISTEAIRGTTLIRLTARWTDSETAVRIAQRVSELAIAATEKAVAVEAGHTRDAVDEQFQSARQRLNAADTALRDRRAAAKATAPGGQDADLARLELERELAKKQYTAVATLFETVRLQVLVRSARLAIFDPPIAADRPLPRGAVRNAAVAGFAAMVLAAITAMVAHVIPAGGRSGAA